MRKASGSTLAVVIAAVALLLVPPGVYFGAYLGLTTRTTRNIQTGGTCRVFRSSWQATVFLPATLIESAITGQDVAPAWPSP